MVLTSLVVQNKYGNIIPVQSAVHCPRHLLGLPRLLLPWYNGIVVMKALTM